MNKKLLIAAALLLCGCRSNYGIPMGKQAVPAACKHVVEREDGSVVVRARINLPPNVVVSP